MKCGCALAHPTTRNYGACRGLSVILLAGFSSATQNGSCAPQGVCVRSRSVKVEAGLAGAIDNDCRIQSRQRDDGPGQARLLQALRPLRASTRIIVSLLIPDSSCCNARGSSAPSRSPTTSLSTSLPDWRRGTSESSSTGTTSRLWDACLRTSAVEYGLEATDHRQSGTSHRRLRRRSGSTARASGQCPAGRGAAAACSGGPRGVSSPRPTANFVLALAVLSPDLIAHFSLATIDGIGCLFIFACVVQWMRYWRNPSRDQAAILAVLLGGMLLVQVQQPSAVCACPFADFGAGAGRSPL